MHSICGNIEHLQRVGPIWENIQGFSTLMIDGLICTIKGNTPVRVIGIVGKYSVFVLEL